MKQLIHLLAGTALSSGFAAAQVTVMATEQFDYVPPALLQNAGGGTGWANAWDLDPAAPNGIVVFDPSVNPPMDCRDSVGNYAGQAQEFIYASRIVDTLAHPGVVDQGKIGADGSTIWISFRTVMYQQFGNGSFGALQLFDTQDPSNEQLLLGSPWGTTSWHWGWDDEGGVGLPPEVDLSTDASVCAKLVFRIDHQPGDERVRMWVDPIADFPINEAPQLDGVIGDLRWDEIRLNSGGSGTHFFWDDITIARGIPSTNVGTNYCGPGVPNSSGLSGTIEAQGSLTVADNNMTLAAFNLPQNAFGFFLVSPTQGFIQNPGGSEGNLCITGAIGRYVGPGEIKNAGSTGSFNLAIDLTAIPRPSGAPVAAQAGETWNFTTWHRDFVGGQSTSNFTDGVEVTFQ